MEHEVINSDTSMPMTLHFAICKFSCSEIVFLKLPWQPPNGFITSYLAMTLISTIFMLTTIHSCNCICIHWLKQTKVTKAIMRETFCNGCWILRELHLKMIWILREYTQIWTWDSSFKGTQTMLHGFATLPSLVLTQACASKMISLDTEFSFWVCDNLATGHICNDKSLFSGEVVPSIFVVGAATGTSKPTLMGTVILRTTDDNGKKHTITLTHRSYMPKLPVNFLINLGSQQTYVDENRFTKKAYEFVMFMIIMFSFGITGDTPKLSRRIPLAYLNVFLALAILV
jgi:hypothetical protein